MRDTIRSGVATESSTNILNGVNNSEKEHLVQTLRHAEDSVLRLLDEAANALNDLAVLRLKCKLSNSRVSGVYRELKELIKVMSVYK